MVLQTDGRRFLVESPKGLRTVSSDHVTGAPAPPARDGKWTRALGAQALFKMGDQIMEGPEFVFERILNHGWDDCEAGSTVGGCVKVLSGRWREP